MVDIVYKKTGAIFNQHTYWTKQPIESITYFIEKYTKKGEVILDPFCGSGMTGLGAILTGRRAILRDISPACIHIATGYNKKLKIDFKELEKFIDNIKDKLIKFYVTNCNHCNKQAKIKYEIIGERYKDKNGEIVSISEELFNSIKNNSEFDKSKGRIQDLTFYEHFVLRICYSCSCSKEKIFKVPNENDLLDKYYLKESRKYPTDFFFGKECKRNFKKNIYRVCDLYSKKNLFALNSIREQILLVEDQNLKDFLLFNFTSILFNTSLMSRYRGYENTSIKMGTYYVPQLIKDNNVVASYVRKILSSYEANKEIFSNTDIINADISLGDATNLIDIEDNSIDLIYTDPPYADIINYSELNLVWESWLGHTNNYQNEMIVCESENKSVENYFILFEKFLAEASRVLKKDKRLILIFHHPNIIFWSKLQKIILKSNFILNLEDTPTRLISANKTSSQHKTDKNTQSFIAIELINNKNTASNSVEVLTKLIFDKIKKNAALNNYNSESDFYDFFVNYCLNKYDLENSIDFIS